MGKKFFILRAHSLESSENTTLKFDSDNDIIIPMAVLDILSKDSLQYNERGKNARIFEFFQNSRFDVRARNDAKKWFTDKTYWK